MGHDLHPDSELGQARRLRGSGAYGRVIEELAPAWIQPTMSHIEIRGSPPIQLAGDNLSGLGGGRRPRRGRMRQILAPFRRAFTAAVRLRVAPLGVR
jgi:hypothetical protein